MDYRREIEARIAKPMKYKWRAHGLGMLRTYLDEAETIRLNLWHKRLQTPGVSLMHTHPWTLRSAIVAGRILNTRWLRVEKDAERAVQYVEDKVLCGRPANPEFALAGKPRDVWLQPQRVEVYDPGTNYQQQPEEIHTTDFHNGTATIMWRGTERTENMEASVFWPVGSEWGDATHTASQEDIIETISAVRSQYQRTSG